MTDSTAAFQAWHTVACRWASCLQPVGRRCITANRVRTSPHAVRLDDLGVWLGRQPEVDALQHTVEARDATIAADEEVLRRVTTERDGLKADLAAANLELTQQGEQVLTLTRDLAVTKAEFAAYVKTHPDVPPARATRYGMNVSASTAAAVKATYGGLPAAKFFYPGALPARFAAAGEGQAPVTYVCFKPNQSDLAAGKLDAAITGYLDSIPTGHQVRLVNWQEPDDEMWKTHIFTAAQHRAASDHLCDLVHAHPAGRDGRAQVWDCYMGFSLDVDRLDWSAVSPKLDGIGWDRYYNNANGHPEKAAEQLKTMADLTKAHGIGAWSLLETGDNPTTFKDGAARAAHWAGVFDACAALGYDDCCYFNAVGTTGDHRLIPGQAYSDPTIAELRRRITA